MKKKILALLALLVVSNLAYASSGNANKDGVSVDTSEVQMADIATKNSEMSQQNMLQLSSDIGVMADRINKMADKINQMADKIVKTQEIQSQNLQITEENALKAQKAIIHALENTNNTEVIKQLKLAKSSLDSVISIKKQNAVANNLSSTKIVNKVKEPQEMQENIGGMNDDNMGGIGGMGGDSAGGGMGGGAGGF